MSSIVIAGDTSGSVTLQAPAVSGSTVLNLPATSGTIQASGAGYTTNGVAYATSATGLVTGSALTFDGTNLTTTGYASAVGLRAFSGGGVRFYNAGNSNYSFISTPAGTGQLQFDTGAGEQMRLTDTGLGIGTSSPATKLAVAGGIAGTAGLNISGGGWGVLPYVANSLVIDNNGGEARFFATGANATTDGSFLFYTGQTDGGANERARINSSGFFKASNTGSYIGATGPYYEFTSNDISTNQSFIFYNNNTSITQTAMMFLGANRNTTNNTFYYFGCFNYQTSTYKLLIADSGNVTNTNNSYGAISDAKLKENIVDTTPKLADLMQVQVRNYNLIGETTKQIGVVAQELETVFPAMIEECPDRDAEGNNLGTTTKSVKYSVFVPMLIKAMQEQQALITTLTERITVLEAK